MIIPLRPETSNNLFPYGTWAMIAINVLIHVVWTSKNVEAMAPWMIDYQTINPVQWLTSAFLHGSWMHLIGNMLFLYTFGMVVEDLVRRWFVPLYLLLALASGMLVQCILLTRGEVGNALGASSAIYGVMTLALVWVPESRITTFVWFGPMWAIMSSKWRRQSTYDIRVMWIASWYIGWELLEVALTRASVSSALLHLCGILVGVPLAMLILRERWIPYDGLDLVSKFKTRGMSPAEFTAYVAEQQGEVPLAVQAPALAAAAAFTPGASGAPAPMNSAGARLRPPGEVTTVIDEPAAPAEPPQSAEVQLSRLYAALDAGNPRVAWAAFTVLQQEFPTCVPGSDALDYLTQLLETTQEHHRVLAVGRLRLGHDATLADALRLRLARVQGLALDEPLPAQRQLAQIDPRALNEADQREYARLEERLARRQRTSRLARPTAAVRTLLLAGLGAAMLGGALGAAEGQMTPLHGKVTLDGGAALMMPAGLSGLQGKDRELVTGASVDGPLAMLTPCVVILPDEALSEPTGESHGVGLRYDVEPSHDWHIAVTWEYDWVDLGGELEAQPMLDLMQGHVARLNKHSANTGVTLRFDGWNSPPKLDKTHKLASWGVRLNAQVTGRQRVFGPKSGNFVFYTTCLFGARGLLRMEAQGDVKAQARIEQALAHVAAAVHWDKGSEWQDSAPDDIADRLGGLSSLIAPHLAVEGGADVPRHDPFKHLWLLWLIPLGLLTFGAWKIRSMAAARKAAYVPPPTWPPTPAPAASQPAGGTARIPASAGSASGTRTVSASGTRPTAAGGATARPKRCTACGTTIHPAASRCGACGASQVR